MIVGLLTDQQKVLYHVVNLYGETVHAYRNEEAAKRSLEGDQRIFTQDCKTKQWIGDRPCPHPSLKGA